MSPPANHSLNLIMSRKPLALFSLSISSLSLPNTHAYHFFYALTSLPYYFFYAFTSLPTTMLRFPHSYSLSYISFFGFNTPPTFSHSYSHCAHSQSSFTILLLSTLLLLYFFQILALVSTLLLWFPHTLLAFAAYLVFFPLLLCTSHVHTSHSHASAFTIAPALVRTLKL